MLVLELYCTLHLILAMFVLHRENLNCPKRAPGLLDSYQRLPSVLDSIIHNKIFCVCGPRLTLAVENNGGFRRAHRRQLGPGSKVLTSATYSYIHALPELVVGTQRPSFLQNLA
jgi:hypothetical protein